MPGSTLREMLAQVVKAATLAVVLLGCGLCGRARAATVWAIDDGDELERIVSERCRCEQAVPKDRERLLLMLAGPPSANSLRRQRRSKNEPTARMEMLKGAEAGFFVCDRCNLWLAPIS